jgi:hypothetical protein
MICYVVENAESGIPEIIKQTHKTFQPTDVSVFQQR